MEIKADKEKWRILILYLVFQWIQGKGGGAKGLTNRKIELRYNCKAWEKVTRIRDN